MAEISDALFPGQTAENRQDIVARVFKLKLKAFYMTCSMHKNLSWETWLH